MREIDSYGASQIGTSGRMHGNGSIGVMGLAMQLAGGVRSVALRLRGAGTSA